MSVATQFACLRNGERIPRSELPELPFPAFRQSLIDGVDGGLRLVALFGHAGPSDRLDLYAILADENEALLQVARAPMTARSYPAITPECAQAHLFEREIAEQFAVRPAGHPWLKPVRFEKPRRSGEPIFRGENNDPPTVGITNFYQVEGKGIHEVGVGPVHAGVIEPGHFRFQCAGEHVFHLEISLGYQHRGVEGSLVGGPNKRTLHLVETLAGDTSIGHATAYCQLVESLSDSSVPARAQWLRGIALELERLANHTGDLGALAGDVGFLPTASYCGRLRGDYLNTTAQICGNRFGRSFVRLGGVGFDVDSERAGQMIDRISKAYVDVENAVNLLWVSASVMARFEETGRISRETCEEIGLVGMAARACGVERDARQQFPSGVYRFIQIPVSTVASGDVFARAYIRWLEIQRSSDFIVRQLSHLPSAEVFSPPKPILPEQFSVALVEGWRGEVCHAAFTDSAGRFERYKIVDPSFHNWSGLAMSLRDQQISDFPLCNKSYNLSYCGYDL